MRKMKRAKRLKTAIMTPLKQRRAKEISLHRDLNCIHIGNAPDAKTLGNGYNGGRKENTFGSTHSTLHDPNAGFRLLPPITGMAYHPLRSAQTVAQDPERTCSPQGYPRWCG